MMEIQERVVKEHTLELTLGNMELQDVTSCISCPENHQPINESIDGHKQTAKTTHYYYD